MTARFLKKRSASNGLAPGSLVFIGNKKMKTSRLRLIDYDSEKLQEIELKLIRDGIPYKETNTVSWFNIDGLDNIELIKDIGEIFNLDPLLLEDVLNTGQRPKVEEFDNALFIVLKMMRYIEEDKTVISEQLSLILGEKFLITFQEQVGDVFEPVRERIRKSRGRIRNAGLDYLAYALLDTVVDNYFLIVEKLGEKIEDLEEDVLSDPTPEVLESINDYKREINFLRKSIRPSRELVIKLTKLDSEFINENTRPYLKELLDLITQVTEGLDTYCEMLNDQLSIYHTSVSNKMNEVMKVLTIFAAIFIPLTFIAGIYGTNFEYFPELSFRYSYFIFWGILVIIAIVMLRYFRKKGWL